MTLGINNNECPGPRPQAFATDVLRRLAVWMTIWAAAAEHKKELLERERRKAFEKTKGMSEAEILALIRGE